MPRQRVGGAAQLCPVPVGERSLGCWQGQIWGSGLRARLWPLAFPPGKPVAQLSAGRGAGGACWSLGRARVQPRQVAGGAGWQGDLSGEASLITGQEVVGGSSESQNLRTFRKSCKKTPVTCPVSFPGPHKIQWYLKI